ncbi:hypothetical protein [Vibrio hepatarius]|uniref:hypothetical protein n=1 Tax=Vibrio hepatarius TaxID=171383 RepID=UPI003736CAFF
MKPSKLTNIQNQLTNLDHNELSNILKFIQAELRVKAPEFNKRIINDEEREFILNVLSTQS